MSSSVKSFVFAAVMCVVCSVLLTLAATTLKPFQESNERADKQKNILKALQLVDGKTKLTKQDVSTIYDKNVLNVWMTPDGRLSKDEIPEGKRVFVRADKGNLVSYAIPVSGYGLWSTIYGYLGLSADGKTVSGITFYKHGETPGLGGEVDKPWFQNQFKGKSIIDSSGAFVSVGVVKGKVTDRVSADKAINYVDGISGATITSQGVTSFLKKDLQVYEPLSSRLRRQGAAQ
ncbi:NADH:ubiquinone reductase (Na(+)-transporting) subunit C [bacterium]|jgi:Na+-transporting NADH:ubiquinone oxidoreductase subunit C|nr:NADH:ubiquinone reductase (Na(+)-transporting) subunit C [bacterium]